MIYAGKEITPQTGYLLARIVPAGRTASGLVIPDTTKEGETLVVVETSAGYFGPAGQLIETTLKPGDQIWPCQNASIAAMRGLPNDVRLMLIEQVAIVARPVKS